MTVFDKKLLLGIEVLASDNTKKSILELIIRLSVRPIAAMI